MRRKHVLLTGGTGGLGMGVTPEVLSRGAASVTLPYVNARDVERLKGILAPADVARLRFVATDLTNEAAVQALVADMERVDVLIHLVGGFSMGATHEYGYDQWKKDLALNLNTTFLVCTPLTLFFAIKLNCLFSSMTFAGSWIKL